MFRPDPVVGAARGLILAFRVEGRGEGLRNLRLLISNHRYDILIQTGKLIQAENLEQEQKSASLHKQAHEEFKSYDSKTVDQAIEKYWLNIRNFTPAQPTGKGIESEENFAKLMNYVRKIDETIKIRETNNFILQEINRSLEKNKVQPAEPQQSSCILV